MFKLLVKVLSIALILILIIYYFAFLNCYYASSYSTKICQITVIEILELLKNVLLLLIQRIIRIYDLCKSLELLAVLLEFILELIFVREQG